MAETGLLEGALTKAQFRAELNIGEATFYALCAEGLPNFLIGRTRYVDMAAAREWLRARKPRPTTLAQPPSPRGRPKKTVSTAQ
jgi:hypothetical protein